MGLFRKKKNKGSTKAEERPTSPTEEREAPPEPHVRTFNTLDQMALAENHKMVDDNSLEDTVPEEKPYINDPPPAREAAFHGPPRFDWIDIVCFVTILFALCVWTNFFSGTCIFILTTIVFNHFRKLLLPLKFSQFTVGIKQ